MIVVIINDILYRLALYETMTDQRDDDQHDRGGQSDRQTADQQQGRQQKRQRTQQSGGQSRGGTGGTPSSVNPEGKQPRRGTTTQISDIFDRDETTVEMKAGLGLFAAVGLGLGIAVLVNELADTQILFTGTGAAAAIAPVVAVLIARRQNRRLPDIRGDLVYATTAITSAGGTLAMLVLIWLFEVIVIGSIDLFSRIIFWVGIAFASAVVGFLSLIVARET